MFDQLKRNWALMTPARQKRTVVVGTVTAFAVGAWIFSVKTTPPKPPSDHLAVNVVAPPQRNTDLADVNASVTALQRQISDFDHRLQSQQDQVDHRFDLLEAQQRGGASNASGHGTAQANTGNNAQLPAPGTGDTITPPGSAPFPAGGQPRLNSLLPGAAGAGGIASPISPGRTGADSTTTPDAEQADGIQIVGDDGDGAADAGSTASGPAAAGAVRTASAKAAEVPETFLPMGAIVTGLAINGGDFPTTRSAQRNPVPMLIRVKKDAILPNNQRASVKECFLMVSGNGELSTGRAQLRAERISCVLKNKRVVEVAVDGYVVGEDGKPGLRGNLASKDGAVIANAMRVAMIGAAGEGLATVVSNTASNVHSAGVNVQLGSNSSSGSQMSAPIGTAFQNIAQYYTDLAKEIVPVVEINPLRQVDVILTKGVSIPI